MRIKPKTRSTNTNVAFHNAVPLLRRTLVATAGELASFYSFLSGGNTPSTTCFLFSSPQPRRRFFPFALPHRRRSPVVSPLLLLLLRRDFIMRPSSVPLRSCVSA
ncbi:hypothetical protein RND81_06G109400 [Saponaria officinalis]